MKNGDGIYLFFSSTGNIIFHNNLVNNTVNAYDRYTNQWDSGTEGNYWSDYIGTDSNGDGIGDTPYSIPTYGGSSVDRYPLIEPYSPPPSDYEGKLLRQTGDFKVYLIEDGKKRHFTSPEALEWNGHSFDDVIEVSVDVINSFEPGSDISITQAIIDKYYALGGAATFGPPAGTGEQTGDPDSAGVICTYVNFQNGAIEYFTNGDQAGNAYAILNPFFDKWASMEYGKSVLGYPISDMSDTQTSSFGTPFKYQNFINGTERGALEYNLTSGDVFEIHGAIYATWSAMDYANSILGLVTSDELEAVASFKGTTGRVSDFENGHLHWHSSGDHYMVTYMTYGDLDELYVSMGGTASWLGFPVMHQEDRGGYGYCEFEGGYIEWDGIEYKALPITGLVHNINKGTDYTTIQAAIDDASPGDEIHVDSGTYIENVDVYKRLTLIGEGVDVVTVLAEDAGDHVFEVTADYVQISGFSVTGATATYYIAGIHLSSANHCNISDNTASNNSYGIYLQYSNNNTLQSNVASNNSYGIYLYHSNSSTLSSNSALNDFCGIYLCDSSINKLSGNTANSNNYFGIYFYCSSNNILSDNNAISNNFSGIYIENSNNNTLQNNTATNTNDGYGIGLGYSSNYNMLINNTANLNNGSGIYLFSSNSNTLYHNNLLNNYNAYDDGTNQWDSGSEGNYYSDYIGNDTNRDGIGDDPYLIPGGESVDRYPLTGIRWLPPEITRSRLGINTHWNHWTEDLSIYEQKIKNFGIVRDQAWWAGLETSDLTGSEWDYANWNYSYNTETLCGKEIPYQSGLDNLVKLYQDEDSPELLLLLNLKNDNISSFETITADQYYDYVYHVVERYDGDGLDDMPGLIRPISYFEVGNEVDYIRTGDSRHGYLSPKDYIEKRLIPAYNAAKAANKDAVVMGSGLGMESDLLGGKTGEFNTAYLEAMYDNITDNGGSKNNNFYMDKIAIHYYSQNEHPELFDENIKEVENVIMDKEGREKPIWITEFAPASPPSLYARLLTLMFANRIEMPVIYNLKNDSEESFGLYNVTCEGDEETITPRESIQVIDTALSTLHGTTPSETENEDISTEPGKTTYKRVFNNSDKKVTVLWYIDTADPGALTNYEVSPESLQTFTVDVLGTANFSQTSPINLEIGYEPTYVVEADLPIGVDLYFNKTTTAGVSTERAASFAVGDTLYGKIKTSTSTAYLVKTYITMTMPDGTSRYAYYDKPDFIPGNDNLLFSDKKVPLYDGVWHATTDDWLWNIYEFTGGDSGIYAWNCWYEDSETGEILGGDSTEYTFSVTPLLVFAITPNSRIAQIGTPVTIFMSVINAGTGNATGVSIAQASSLLATIGYQVWDGATLTGTPDTPVDIGSGETVNYVLTINATAEFVSSTMTFDVSGTNGGSAPVSGVNTLTMAASATPYADVIMMSTSLDVSTAVNTATAFALATTNVGSASATDVSLIVEVPTSITGLSYQVNETNLDSSIKGPAAGLTIPVGGCPTFAVFLTPTQPIDYDPANNRIVLKLVDGSGKVVGAQSVAVAAVVA